MSFSHHFGKMGNSSVQNHENEMFPGLERNKALYIEKFVTHQFNTIAKFFFQSYYGTIYDRYDDSIFPIFVHFPLKEVIIGCSHM